MLSSGSPVVAELPPPGRYGEFSSALRIQAVKDEVVQAAQIARACLE